jgi:hypothetical protein
MKKILLVLFIFIHCIGFCQDEIHEKAPFKNTIRYNLSKPSILGFGNIIFGYERILSDNRSFTIDFGLNRLPVFEIKNENSESDLFLLLPGGKNRGLQISADYRFYLKSENKYKAPRGVYLGPYYSFNTFNRSKDWELSTSNLDGIVGSNLGIKIHTIGAELGYQFQLSKRFLLDFVLFGPGVGFYSLKTDFDSNLDPEDSELIIGQINDFLLAKFPGFNSLADGSGFDKSGSLSVGSLGYRFMINIGYRF